MKHLSIKYHNGSTTIVHFDAAIASESGYTLCGHDTDGDSRLGWDAAKVTTKRVTCERCQEIVSACKSIKDDEISNISR